MSRKWYVHVFSLFDHGDSNTPAYSYSCLLNTPAYSCCPTICKAQIAALLATLQPSIELQYMDVQMQSGSYDCALFAIAFATAIVFGKQPGLFLFNQSKMRQHLKKCLEQGSITMFSANETGNKGQNH